MSGKNGASNWLRQVVCVNLYVVLAMLNMRNQIIPALINAMTMLKYNRFYSDTKLKLVALLTDWQDGDSVFSIVCRSFGLLIYQFGKSRRSRR